MGLFHVSLTLLNNEHKPVTVHTRSKYLSFFGLCAVVADTELVISLQICWSGDTSQGCCDAVGVTTNPAKPHRDFGDAFAVSSHSAAFLLLGVQQVHSTWAMGLLLGGLWPKPPCAGVSLNAPIASVYTETKKPQVLGVLGSANLWIDIKCSSTVPIFSAVLRALCAATNLHFLS